MKRALLLCLAVALGVAVAAGTAEARYWPKVIDQGRNTGNGDDHPWGGSDDTPEGGDIITNASSPLITINAPVVDVFWRWFKVDRWFWRPAGQTTVRPQEPIRTPADEPATDAPSVNHFSGGVRW